MATRGFSFTGRRSLVRAAVGPAFLPAVLAVAIALALPAIATAQGPSPAGCAALSNLRIEDANLLSAAVVPATADLAEHCRVLGYVRPAINFEIRLP